MPDSPRPEKQLLTLLKGVSRSFYLSVRLLPAGLRQPVGVGYLLARASDTLADAPGVPAAERLALLDEFVAMVRGGRTPAPLRAGLAATAGERELLAALPACIEALR